MRTEEKVHERLHQMELYADWAAISGGFNMSEAEWMAGYLEALHWVLDDAHSRMPDSADKLLRDMRKKVVESKKKSPLQVPKKKRKWWRMVK